MVTLNRRALVGAALLTPLVGWSTISLAQVGTGSHPIRIVVPYPPGGPLDVAARAIAEAVRPDLGTGFVVDDDVAEIDRKSTRLNSSHR